MISRLKKQIVIVQLAVGMTDDAVQAAIATQTDLSAWYREAYSKCKTDGDADQEGICMAAIDRLYQGRNIKFVLGTQDGSFVRQVFEKWRDRLKDLVLPI